MKVYTVYKTTNLINGMFYIGVHKTSNPTDSYLGSGKRLKCAIKKYGTNSFVKEILYSFNTKEEAYLMESKLVNIETISEQNCYNLNVGGSGGWYHINETPSIRIPKNVKAAVAMNKTSWNDSEFRKRKTEEARLLFVRLHKEGKLKPVDQTGRRHSEETKRKIGQANKIRQTKKPSRAGTKWITDGVYSKTINVSDVLPDGWFYGRVMPKTQ